MKTFFLLSLTFTVACSGKAMYVGQDARVPAELEQITPKKKYDFDSLKDSNKDAEVSPNEESDMFVPAAEIGC